MAEQLQSFGFVTCIRFFSPLVILFLLGAPTAQAKHCRAERPSEARAHWSYRLIDGRKCWYEGEAGLAKSSLQWPADAPPSGPNSPPRSAEASRPVPPPKSSTPGTSPVSPLAAPAQLVSEQAPIRILTTKPKNLLPLSDGAGFDERWRALEASGKY
jgi:hypothetical protein